MVEDKRKFQHYSSSNQSSFFVSSLLSSSLYLESRRSWIGGWGWLVLEGFELELELVAALTTLKTLVSFYWRWRGSFCFLGGEHTGWSLKSRNAFLKQEAKNKTQTHLDFLPCYTDNRRKSQLTQFTIYLQYIKLMAFCVCVKLIFIWPDCMTYGNNTVKILVLYLIRKDL